MFLFFQAEDGIRDGRVTGVQTCALPISGPGPARRLAGGPLPGDPGRAVESAHAGAGRDRGDAPPPRAAARPRRRPAPRARPVPIIYLATVTLSSSLIRASSLGVTFTPCVGNCRRWRTPSVFASGSVRNATS